MSIDGLRIVGWPQGGRASYVNVILYGLGSVLSNLFLGQGKLHNK